MSKAEPKIDGTPKTPTRETELARNLNVLRMCIFSIEEELKKDVFNLGQAKRNALVYGGHMRLTPEEVTRGVSAIATMES